MRTPAWSRKLLVGIALLVGIHAYGWGMHIVLEEVAFEGHGPAVYDDDPELEWSVGGDWISGGAELYIRLSETSDGTLYVGFGNVDLDNLGPITFDGTNAIPYFDDDGFEGGSEQWTSSHS